MTKIMEEKFGGKRIAVPTDFKSRLGKAKDVVEIIKASGGVPVVYPYKGGYDARLVCAQLTRGFRAKDSDALIFENELFERGAQQFFPMLLRSSVTEC